MEHKDNRQQSKRKMMKQAKYKFHHAGNHTTTSSSTPPKRGGIADVADSSDDRCVTGARLRQRWAGGAPPPQERHYSLETESELEVHLNDVQQAQMHAADFAMLSSLPASIGGHFKFSSEKNWEIPEDDKQFIESTPASEYFNLNLKLLNAGVATIPFHKRLDLPSSMFTQEEIKVMEQSAEAAEEKYKNIMQNANNKNPSINVVSGSIKSAGSAKSTIAPPNSKSDVNSVAIGEDELDELLNMTTNVSKMSLTSEKTDANQDISSPGPNTTEETAAVSDDAKNDIQEWLDNVLEED